MNIINGGDDGGVQAGESYQGDHPANREDNETNNDGFETIRLPYMRCLQYAMGYGDMDKVHPENLCEWELEEACAYCRQEGKKARVKMYVIYPLCVFSLANPRWLGPDMSRRCRSR